MNKPKQIKRWIVYSIPFLFLAGMSVKPIATVVSGEIITLHTQPIDPRDLFRGDHVLLDLEIETVPYQKLSKAIQERLPDSEPESSKISDEEQSWEKFEVYSILKEKENGIYEVEAVKLTKPETGIFLKGELEPWTALEKEKVVTIQYDIDRYFVPENTGKELEKQSNAGKALVKAKVKDGYAVVQEVVPE